jgi:hypothetical protein
LSAGGIAQEQRVTNKLAAIALGAAVGALIISIISLVRSFP